MMFNVTGSLFFNREIVESMRTSKVIHNEKAKHIFPLKMIIITKKTHVESTFFLIAASLFKRERERERDFVSHCCGLPNKPSNFNKNTVI